MRSPDSFAPWAMSRANWVWWRRVIACCANIGVDGGQEVPHLHVHLFGGKPLGRMIPA
jgi:hypothetical protein